MIVEVLAVGTELLLGQIVNSNAAAIGTRLADAGFDHIHQSVVGDNEGRIADAIHLADSRADALIITGGIGPTQDDLTREAIARAGEVPLVFNEEYAERLREWWSRRGREMPESNLRQAYQPEGSDLIPNPKGTAPGLRVRIGNLWVFAVPGVPAEMIPMVEREILPFLRAEAGDEESVVVSRVIRTWGESESRIGEMLADLYDDGENPSLAFLASAAEIKIRLTAKAGKSAEAEALIAPVEAEVRRRLGARVFGADDDTVEQILFHALSERSWLLGTAESATGGMIATRLTSVAGSSAHFRGAIVAYDAAVKESTLGVAAATIEEHGVVSEAVALEMAAGAAKLLGVDVIVAVTGVAGPDPHGAPVGTMVIAVQTPEDAKARTLRMPGDRERIRTYTTTAALHFARLAVTGAWWDGDGSNYWLKR